MPSTITDERAAPPTDSGALVTTAGWCGISAGVLGLLGLASTIPWPELYSFDALPISAIHGNPDLLPVLIGHYAILGAGGLFGLLTGALLGVALRGRAMAAASALVTALGAGTMGYAGARRAIDVAANDGVSTVELQTTVMVGGAILLLGSLVLTLVLRRDTGRIFLLLGISAPVLVAAGTAAFAILGESAFPVIWGVTFPPPPDYLLAVWFIALGWLARTGQLPTRQRD